MTGKDVAQNALERIAMLTRQNEELSARAHALAEANGVLEASNRTLKGLLFEVSEALGDSSMARLLDLYTKVYTASEGAVLPADVSTRIAALEKFTPPGMVKGTTLGRVLGQQGERWTLAIGALSAPKMFFTGDSIEEVLSQAETALPNAEAYQKKAAGAGVILFG
jgi:hypothetical protein